MEASALQIPAGLAQPRLSHAVPLLRLRSDDQLVALFRAGSEDAFRVIHDRYRQRLFAYTRQMLPGSRQDAEDALQDVFVRAYSGLRAGERPIALRAWLYRVAHNRCIDELRRPPLPAPEVLELVRAPDGDPLAAAERRESLRRLIADVRRLPEQQRSALLMRELVGLSYSELAEALGVTVSAVKSLLVRARISLAAAGEARDTACVEIRGELALAHGRGVRASGMTRRHLRDCPSCRAYRGELRGLQRRLASMAPVAGPLGVLAKLTGWGGGGGSAAVGGGGIVLGGSALTMTAGHVVAMVAAVMVTAGGAVGFQQTFAPAHPHHAHPRASAAAALRAVVAPAQAAPQIAAATAAQAADPSVTPSSPGTAAAASPSSPATPDPPAPPAAPPATTTPAPTTPPATVPVSPPAGLTTPSSVAPSGSGDPSPSSSSPTGSTSPGLPPTAAASSSAPASPAGPSASASNAGPGPSSTVSPSGSGN